MLSKTKITLPAILFLAAAITCNYGCKKDDEDEIPAIESAHVTVSYYNTSDAYQIAAEETDITIKSNRGVSFDVFYEDTEELAKIEVDKSGDGRVGNCESLGEDGDTRLQIFEYPAVTTTYTFTATTNDGTSKEIGKIKVNVQSAEKLYKGGGTMGNPALFGARKVGSPSGGFQGPVLKETDVMRHASLLDFATTKEGGDYKIYSPHLIKQKGQYPRLVNDCSYQTTKFAVYTGNLDVRNNPDSVLLADIQALTIAGNTHEIVVVEGSKVMFETSDGKKGILEVEGIPTNPADPETFGVYIVIEQ